MAQNRRQGGAAEDGFKHWNLTINKARALHHSRYPTPPDMRHPTDWRLSVSGIGIPPEPQLGTMRWVEEVHAHRETLTEEQQNGSL
jgi:hypothetical protein